MLESRIAEGWLRHRRCRPVAHQFRYDLCMILLNLDEIDAVTALSPLWSSERRNLVEFRRRDYLTGAPGTGSGATPKNIVARTILEKTGRRFNGNVRMLTQPRYWGFCFNPVTFYFCFLEDQQRPEFIVADIHNTPWNEHYQYVLPIERARLSSGGLLFEFPKDFHVSPFMPMDIEYAWRFCLNAETVMIHMDLFRNSEKLFDATLLLKLRPVTSSALSMLPFKYALICHRVFWRIYWNALRLWLKRVPFFTHPDPP